MNINKFTQNSLQAVQGCEKVAYEYGNQEVEQEHLLYSLVTQEDGLIPKSVSYTHLDLLCAEEVSGGSSAALDKCKSSGERYGYSQSTGSARTVSYTHLDVYKRQYDHNVSGFCNTLSNCLQIRNEWETAWSENIY